MIHKHVSQTNFHLYFQSSWSNQGLINHIFSVGHACKQHVTFHTICCTVCNNTSLRSHTCYFGHGHFNRSCYLLTTDHSHARDDSFQYYFTSATVLDWFEPWNTSCTLDKLVTTTLELKGKGCWKINMSKMQIYNSLRPTNSKTVRSVTNHNDQRNDHNLSVVSKFKCHKNFWRSTKLDWQITRLRHAWRSSSGHLTTELYGQQCRHSTVTNSRPITRMLLSWSTPSIFESSWLTTVSWTAVLPATEPRALQMASISSNMMMCRPLFGPICAQHDMSLIYSQIPQKMTPLKFTIITTV